LEAALEVMRYNNDSVRRIFGDATGDPIADRILDELRFNPEGLRRTEINHLFDRHQNAKTIAAALGKLEAAGLACRKKVLSANGRPPEIWLANRAVASPAKCPDVPAPQPPGAQLADDLARLLEAADDACRKAIEADEAEWNSKTRQP